MIQTDADQAKQMARQAMDQLITEVENGHSEQLRAYLAMLARFHRYSPGNVFLIQAQRPGAVRVAGYSRWKALGRQVRRREKAIQILAPILRKGEEDETVVAFKAVGVFDVSQTEGQPLETFARVQGDPGGYLDRLKALIGDRGIHLRYSATIGQARGLSGGGLIVLRPDLEPAEAFSVLVHELAHELLHQEKTVPASQTVRETEAEAVAFVVCQAAGLETNTSSSDYIQLYQGNRETLLKSLERIQKTAARIIPGILPQNGLSRSEDGLRGEQKWHNSQSRDFVQGRSPAHYGKTRS